MIRHDTQLRNLVARYWQDGATDDELAQRIVMHAMASSPCCPRDLARAVQISERLGPSPLQEQVRTRLHASLDDARWLMALVDALGDPRQDPAQVVFDVLPQAVADIDLADVEVSALRQATRGVRHRPAAAAALLSCLGWARLPDELRERLKAVLDALESSANEQKAAALLVAPDDSGLVLDVRVDRSDSPGVKGVDRVDPVMDKQATTVFQLDQFAGKAPGMHWALEWAVNYSGNSLGLSLYLACLVELDNFPPDPLLAATGTVEAGGRVTPVESIHAKIKAAVLHGFRRVLLPEANRGDAEAALERDGAIGDLALLFVDHVSQVPERLAQATDLHELSFDGRVRLARASIPRYELSLVKENNTDNATQLHVADAAGRAVINVYTGRKGTVTAAGPAGPTLQLAQRLVGELFTGPTSESRTPIKRHIPDTWRQERLRELLGQAGAQPVDANGRGEAWRYDMRRGLSTAQVTLWTSGTCMVNGSAPAFDELAGLVGRVLTGLAHAEPTSAPAAAPTASPSRPAAEQWIGTDESGKGDYFGPLVSAAVYVDPAVSEQLAALGVRDSKKLKDARVRRLAAQVRQAADGRFAVTPINPPKYNALHAEFKREGKSLNSLLAWGHTRSIKTLLSRGLQPECVVVDQFADARYIEARLKEEQAAGLEIVQYPKAEADIAVAAASILARDGFLAWLDRASAEFGLTLPKGASAQVVEAAKAVYARGGMKALGMVAKLSFKTTAKVTGHD